MKVCIEIDTDRQAFDDDFRLSLLRVLDSVSSDILAKRADIAKIKESSPNSHIIISGPLRVSSGEIIGSIRVEDDG